MLRLNRIALLAAMGISSFLFYGVTANADQEDQSTKLTFSEPVHIPGTTLPAGTYLFKVQDNRFNAKDVVQIFKEDGTILYATETTIPTIAAKANDHAMVTLAQEGNGEPLALVKWFYPAEATGHEFVYSGREEQQISEDQQQNVVADGTPVSLD